MRKPKIKIGALRLNDPRSVGAFGTGSPAWAMDVQIRNGDDGRAQFWAWTQLGDEVKGMIEKGEITFVSIAYAPNATHPMTGESIGALLTSIAFTNKPFIRDLTPLAASDFAADLLANMRAKPEFVDVVDRMVRAAKGATDTTQHGAATMDFQKRIAKIFSINVATEGAEDAIVTEAEAAVKCKRDLGEVLKDSGFASLSDLVKNLPGLLKAKEELKGLHEKFEAAVKELAGFKDVQAEAEVAAAMSVHKYPDSAKKLMLKAFKEDPEGFRKDYPIPDEQRAHLLSTYAAGKDGVQVTTPKTGRALTIEQTTPTNGGAGDPIDLRNFTGNQTQKIIAHLKKNDPSFEKLPWKDQVERAGTFRQQNVTRLVFA